MNQSKTKDLRYWAKWRNAGAVSSVVELKVCMINFTEAKYWLESARHGSKNRNIESSVKYLRKYAKKANASLLQLGTSTEELRELVIKGYISDAKSWLEGARQGSKNRNIELSVRFLRKYAKKANTTLKQLGTSNEELKELIVSGYISEARDWLESARHALKTNTSSCINYIKYIRKYVAKASVSHEQIGTSEKELEEFKKALV
jgi:hypothetical protein